MKVRFRRAAAVAGILSIINLINHAAWSQTELLPHLTPSPGTSRTPSAHYTTRAQSDEEVCAAYYQEEVRRQMDGTCRQFSQAGRPTPTASPSRRPHGQVMSYESEAECNQEFRARWGELAQHCDAIRAGVQARSGMWATAGVLTAAAVVCGFACGCTQIPACVASAYSGLQAACSWSGVGAAVFEVGTLLSLVAISGVPLSENLAWSSGVGAGAGLVGAGTNSLLGRGGHPCLASIIMAAGVAAKYGNISGTSASIDAERQAALALGSFATVPRSGSPSPTPLPHSLTGPSGSSGGSLTQNRSSASGSGGNGIPAGFFGAEPLDRYRDLMTGAASAAPIDPHTPYGRLINQMDRGKVAAALSDLGLSDQDLFKRMGNQSLSEIVGSAPYASSDVTTGIAQIENAAKSGQLTMKLDDGGSMTTVAGGGRGEKSSTQAKGILSFGALGALSGGGGSATSEIGFTKQTNKRTAPATNDDDIWHAGWTGSIFQIISDKLHQTHDRVDRLEWITPLNRALAGLPAKPPKNDKGK